MDARFQALEGLARQDGHGLLGQSTGPIVHAFVRDQVDHHPGVVDLAGLDGGIGPLDGVRAGESAGQGRVQVDHPAGKALQEGVGKHAHPARQDDPIRLA